MTETVIPPRSVRAVVGTRVTGLQKGYLANRAESVASLARLRRAVGKEPGSVLDILNHTLAEEFLQGWRGDDPSWAEIGAHHALTLFALHQQSQRTGMHRSGHGLGSAVRTLIPDKDYQPTHPVARRFAMLGTADSLTEMTYHLRGVIQLLRGAAVPLDYGLLAEELAAWQRPGGADRVRLRWGRDFHLPRTTQTDAE